jgi:hypothetical protein
MALIFSAETRAWRIRLAEGQACGMVAQLRASASMRRTLLRQRQRLLKAPAPAASAEDKYGGDRRQANRQHRRIPSVSVM